MPNRLTGSLQGPCQTRPRAGLSPDIALAPGETPLLRLMLGEEASAGSARTRRSFRSSRRGPIENSRRGFGNGLAQNTHVECRDDSVKHTTSPSRRESARRAIRSKVFPKSVCRYRTFASGAAPPRNLSLSSSTRSRATRFQSIPLSAVAPSSAIFA